jgi:uncharacterized protein (DUF58 family)
MWWKTTSRRSRKAAAQPGATGLLDEAFLRRLERLSLNANRALRGGLSGAHPSLRRLPAPTFSDHRPYSASDDLRYVDWNAYARQEHLFLKLGETEQDVPAHILLDRSASMQYGQGDQHKLHYGRMLLAALGYLALSSGDRLTVAAFDAMLASPWGPTQGKAAALDLLRHTNAIAPGGESRIGDVLRQYTRERSGGLIVLISDLWTIGDIDAALRAAMPPRWQLLLLHLLHQDELAPPLQGDVELEDSETAERVQITAEPATLERYRQRVSSWCSLLEAACARRGATYHRLTTDQPLERSVIPYLRHRQALSG